MSPGTTCEFGSHRGDHHCLTREGKEFGLDQAGSPHLPACKRVDQETVSHPRNSCKRRPKLRPTTTIRDHANGCEKMVLRSGPSLCSLPCLRRAQLNWVLGQKGQIGNSVRRLQST